MASVTRRVHVEGLRELEDALRKLPRATGKATLRRAVKKAADPLMEDARDRAPERLGHLKESFAVSKVVLTSGSGAAGKAAFAEAMKGGATRAEARAAASEAAASVDTGITSATIVLGPGRHPQAIFQEFGTSHHGAQPFMRPAWDAGQDQAAASIRDVLWEEIEKAAARLARKAAKLLRTI